MTNAIATVAKALGEAGAELRHVVRTVVYILDMADAHYVARGGDVRRIASGKHARPGRRSHARVEIEVTAVMHD